MQVPPAAFRAKTAGIGVIRGVVVLSLFFIVVGVIFNLLVSSRKVAHRNRVIGEMQKRGEKALDAIAGDLSNAIIALGSCPLQRVLYKSVDSKDAKRASINILTATPRDVGAVRSFVGDNLQSVSLWNDFSISGGEEITFCNADVIVKTKVVSVDGDAEKSELNALTVEEPLQFIRWGYATIAAKLTSVRYEIAMFEGAPALLRTENDDKKLVLAKDVNYLELKYFYSDGSTAGELAAEKELIGLEVALTVLPATKFDPALNESEYGQGIGVWRDLPYYKMNIVPHPYKISVAHVDKTSGLDAIKLESVP